MKITLDYYSEVTCAYFHLVCEVTNIVHVEQDFYADNPWDYYGYTECEFEFVDDECYEEDEEFQHIKFNRELLTDKDHDEINKRVVELVEQKIK